MTVRRIVISDHLGQIRSTRTPGASRGPQKFATGAMGRRRSDRSCPHDGDFTSRVAGRRDHHLGH